MIGYLSRRLCRLCDRRLWSLVWPVGCYAGTVLEATYCGHCDRREVRL